MGRRPLPSVRDLSRDGRWSTYDVSVLKKMGGRRCVQTRHPLKLPSPTKLPRLGHFPPASQAGRLAGTVFYVFSLVRGATTETIVLFKRIVIQHDVINCPGTTRRAKEALSWEAGDWWRKCAGNKWENPRHPLDLCLSWRLHCHSRHWTRKYQQTEYPVQFHSSFSNSYTSTMHAFQQYFCET